MLLENNHIKIIWIKIITVRMISTIYSVSVCNINALTTPPNAILSEDMCLQLLRKKGELQNL